MIIKNPNEQKGEIINFINSKFDFEESHVTKKKAKIQNHNLTSLTLKEEKLLPTPTNYCAAILLLFALQWHQNPERERKRFRFQDFLEKVKKCFVLY